MEHIPSKAISPRSPFGSALHLLAKLLTSRAIPRPLVAVAVGFCIACTADFVPDVSAIASSIALIIALIGILRARQSVLLLASIALLGFSLGLARTAYVAREPTLAFTRNRLISVRGVIDSLPQERSYTVGFTIRASAFNANGQWIDIDEPIAVRLMGGAEERGRWLDEGDEITLSGILSHSAQHYETMPDLQIVSRAPDDLGHVDLPAQTLFQRLASHGARSIEAIFSQCLGHDDAATMDALLLGDKQRLPPEIWSAFVATSSVHLLATAGLHVGIVVWVFNALLRLLTVPRKLSATLCILMVWAYAIMAGGRPAVERAAFVVTVYFAAILFERIPDLLSALALCAIVTLWINPALIGDSGFQLTFLTVIGIVALMEPISSGVEILMERFGTGWRARFAKRLIDIELLSLAAQASSAPLVAYYFNIVAVAGVPANMIAVPIIVLLLPISLVMVIAGAISHPAGVLIAKIAVAPLLHAAVHVVATISSISGASVSVQQPSIVAVVAYYIVLIGGSFAAHTYSRQAGAASLRGGIDRSADSQLFTHESTAPTRAATGERG